MAPLGAADLAVGGYTVPQVHSEVDRAVLAPLEPRVVVLLIGTNDLSDGVSPQQVAGEVAATVTDIRFHQPGARVLLLGILPRGPDTWDPLRWEVVQTNNLLASLADGTAVTFLDVGRDFLESDGTISSKVLEDYVHPTALGYSILTAAIEPSLEQLLGGSPAFPGGGFKMPLASDAGPPAVASPPGYLGSGPATAVFQFGGAGWTPLVGDWTGRGHAGIGSFDPATATWYLRNSASAGPADWAFVYGLPGWVPLVGDWTGRGRDGIGVFDPTTATFYLKNDPTSGAPDFVFHYGLPGWVPVAGDWDGRGHTGVGVFDPATAGWYLKNDARNGPPDLVFHFGSAGWRPVTGDWAGSGHTTIGVVDPATMNWYLSTQNRDVLPDAIVPFQYGAAGWAAVTGDWDGSGRSGIAAVSLDGIWYLRSNSRH
jgi:lysophospholipase L1-like esterase